MEKVFEVRAGSITYFGVGALKKIKSVLKVFRKMGVERIGVITGKSSYKVSGAWNEIQAALLELKVEYLHFDGVMANPTVDQVDSAFELFKEFSPGALIGIGGGSALDVTKGVAVLLANPERNARELYRCEFYPLKALPMVLVNLTHGTGSEIDRYSVATIPEDQVKVGIGYDCLYALYSIDDPSLTLNLPLDQSIYTAIDALNHAIEASTTLLSSPYTFTLSKEAAHLVFKYLPILIEDPKNIEARKWLLYASMLAGIAIDCSVTHITHLLEHAISALKPEVPHGLGLALIAPAVMEVIYPAVSDKLNALFEPINPPHDPKGFSERVKKWHCELGIRKGLSDYGFKEGDLDDLLLSVKSMPGAEKIFSIAPIKLSDGLIREIFIKSL